MQLRFIRCFAPVHVNISLLSFFMMFIGCNGTHLEVTSG